MEASDGEATTKASSSILSPTRSAAAARLTVSRPAAALRLARKQRGLADPGGLPAAASPPAPSPPREGARGHASSEEASSMAVVRVGRGWSVVVYVLLICSSVQVAAARDLGAGTSTSTSTTSRRPQRRVWRAPAQIRQNRPSAVSFA